MAEYEAPPVGDRVVNRGDVEPKPHEQYLEQHPEVASAERAKSQPSASRDQDVRLFQEPDLADMRRRWSDIQASFVDEPRKAVQQADSLIGESVQRLTQTFSSARERLEEQWSKNSDGVTTEDLRVALQRYRAFFDRLLSV
jgi:hypothetical protein